MSVNDGAVWPRVSFGRRASLLAVKGPPSYPLITALKLQGDGVDAARFTPATFGGRDVGPSASIFFQGGDTGFGRRVAPGLGEVVGALESCTLRRLLGRSLSRTSVSSTCSLSRHSSCSAPGTLEIEIRWLRRKRRVRRGQLRVVLWRRFGVWRPGRRPFGRLSLKTRPEFAC